MISSGLTTVRCKTRSCSIQC